MYQKRGSVVEVNDVVLIDGQTGIYGELKAIIDGNMSICSTIMSNKGSFQV